MINYLKNKQSAFTIVELLIVIVVIGILAAITVVAYNGIQARARDTIRINDLASIKKALQLYHVDNGNLIQVGSGCGGSGNGGGWLNYQDGTTYPKSTTNCLKDAGYISKEIRDPSGMVACGGVNCRAYFKQNCGTGDSVKVYLFANLETRPNTTTDTDGTCGTNLDTDIGSNYVLQVN